jgi:hypothetical protein
VQGDAVGEALDRRDRASLRCPDLDLAREDGLAVDENGASAARAFPAAGLSTGQPQLVAEQGEQMLVRLVAGIDRLAVDRDARHGESSTRGEVVRFMCQVARAISGVHVP